MAATAYALTNGWSADSRYTAGAAIDVNLANPSAEDDHIVAWTLTLSDTAPTISVAQAGKIKPLYDKPMTLASGDRLWMAIYHRAAGTATLEV